MRTRDQLRRTAEKRNVIFTLKLSEAEATALKTLAEKHYRRPGDELRAILAAEVARVQGEG